MSQFKSLFLHLMEEEEAVFASVFPLILTMPSSIEGGAAAAAGEHSSRLLPFRGGPASVGVGPTSLYPVRSSARSNVSAAALAALHSPAEDPGNYIEGGFSSSSSLRESASEAQARRGAPLRSLIFAVGSARAEALLVVLRSGHVVVFGLDRPHEPPYELYRIRPLPTTQQLQVSREMSHKSRQNKSSGSRRGRGEATASAVSVPESTCASLIPLAISYCCRIVVPADGRSRGGTAGRTTDGEKLRYSTGGIAGSAGEESQQTVEEEEIYLRGLVGSSDGRVSLFSDVAYTLSFAAHETPVAQVDAVLLPPSSLTLIGSSSISNPSPGAMGNYSGSQSRSPTALPRQGGGASTAAGLSVSSALHQQERLDPLQRAMERLGIVTSGADGVILLWRRIEGAMSPVLLLRPTSFARRVPYTVYHPSALSALLSTCAPSSRREAAIDAELCCPPSCLVHATSQHAHGLRVRQFAPSQITSGPTSALTSSNSNKSGHSAIVDTSEKAAPTWLSLPMPGSWTAAVTAMATHHGISLIAREAMLFSFVHFDARSATRVWKAESAITQLVLQDKLALAICAKPGTVHVLTIHPVTGQCVHQRTFHSYKNRPIHHVSMHEASLLMCIVDVCGSTELVQLPNDVLLHQHAHPLQGGYTLGSAECLNLLASMAALRAKVSIEDVKGAGVGLDAPNGATSMYEVNAALDQLNERLLLARLAVPEECDRYMAANQHVF